MHKRWVAIALLLLAASAPAAACPDLVDGGSETVAEVAAGGTTAVAAYINVGPVYVVGSAEVGKLEAV